VSQGYQVLNILGDVLFSSRNKKEWM